jgi:biopolymer transport protein ExbD
VLVLLIIFIVITPAVNNAVRLPLARHSVRPGSPPGSGQVILVLTVPPEAPSGKVLVDGVQARDPSGAPLAFNLADEPGRRRLRSFIAGKVREREDRRVFLKADAELPFRFVDVVLQVCREGGASEAALVTSEDPRAMGGE